MQWTCRALGLVLAYSLVVQSVLVPLQAFATAMPDRDGAVICWTEGTSIAAVKAQDKFDKSNNPHRHHDCEFGCLMSSSLDAGDFEFRHFVLFKIKAYYSSIRFEKLFILNKHSSSILAHGKAPGAPPIL